MTVAEIDGVVHALPYRCPRTYHARTVAPTTALRVSYRTRKRSLAILISVGVFVMPLGAEAQPTGKVPRIGRENPIIGSIARPPGDWA